MIDSIRKMSDIEIALEQLSMQILCTVNTTSIKTCQVSIDAIYKQVRKKADETITDELEKIYSCPLCNRDVRIFENYCAICGQRLIFTESEVLNVKT